MPRNYSTRDVKEYNAARRIFQHIACGCFIIQGVKSKYNLKKVQGLENFDKTKQYVVASNHVTGFDPFFVQSQIKIPMAYMAKKELFEPFWSRVLMDWCGAFAVDRDNVSVATIKTALSIKKTTWSLGIFPQGTRCNNGKLENVSKGFVTMAKKMNFDILPLGIVLEDTGNKNGKKDIYVKVGTPIPNTLAAEEIFDTWCHEVAKLSGLEYIPE